MSYHFGIAMNVEKWLSEVNEICMNLMVAGQEAWTRCLMCWPWREIVFVGDLWLRIPEQWHFPGRIVCLNRFVPELRMKSSAANDWCYSCDQNLSLSAFWVMPFLIDISISTGKSLSIRNSCYWCLFDLQLRQSSNQIFTYWTFDAVGERSECLTSRANISFGIKTLTNKFCSSYSLELIFVRLCVFNTIFWYKLRISGWKILGAD